MLQCTLAYRALRFPSLRDAEIGLLYVKESLF